MTLVSYLPAEFKMYPKHVALIVNNAYNPLTQMR